MNQQHSKFIARCLVLPVGVGVNPGITNSDDNWSIERPLISLSDLIRGLQNYENGLTWQKSKAAGDDG